MTTVALGSDHRGAKAVQRLVAHLEQRGFTTHVLGVSDGSPTDYPDQAELVARAVAQGDADRGVLVCGSGIGMSIAANKIPGVRAALACDAEAAGASRRHNDANIVCLSGDRGRPEDLAAIVDAFLATEFEGGRHARRVDKIKALDQACAP